MGVDAKVTPSTGEIGKHFLKQLQCLCARNAEEETPPEGYLYFLGSAREGEMGAIKVGYTRIDPKVRLSKLQIGNPVELLLLRTMRAYAEYEHALHYALSASWVRGEWFEETAVRSIMHEVTPQHIIEFIDHHISNEETPS